MKKLLLALLLALPATVVAQTCIDNNPDEQTVTGAASDIDYYSARVTAYANNILDNLATDLKVGVIYCTSGTPSKTNGTQVTVAKQNIAADGKYTVLLSGLTENTTYYYRSFVYQSGIYFYGTTRSFTTRKLQSSINFVTGNSSAVTCFSAKVSAQMQIDAQLSYNSLSCGVCYDTVPTPTTKAQASQRDALGAYSVTLRALMGGTVYYYRPYAVVDGTTLYGDVSSFRTLDDNVVQTGVADANGTVRSKLTIGGGAYSSLTLGLCWSKSNSEPTIEDSKLTCNEVDDDNSYLLSLSGYGTIYYRAYVLIDGVAHYGEVKRFTKELAANNRNYVDLGLSVMWATTNVGASSPKDYGDYFAWGEITKKNTYDWSTYKYCNGSSSLMTKYCTSPSYGTVDNKLVLELSDDAAHANWGGDWRIPTDEEWTELRTRCTWTWTNINGKNGYKVTAPNGNYIFLPAAGYRLDSSLNDVGSFGYYWSSTLSLSSDSTDYSAYDVNFYLSDVCRDCYVIRCSGQSIRPVLAEN